MKKFLGTTMLALITFIAFTQPNKSGLQGTVSDAENKTAVAGATASLNGQKVLTGNDGHFVFERLNPGTYELLISSLG